MKIVNIGSLNVDNTYHVDAFLLPGETKSSLSYQVFCGGKGLNQSIAVARAGLKVCHAGYFGDGSDILGKMMEQSGVDISLMRRVPGKCGHTVIEVDAKGQNCILLYGGTNRMLSTEYIDSVIANCKKDDIVLLQNETNLVDYAIVKAHEKGIKVAFNAAPMEEGVKGYHLSFVSYLFVNEVEGATLSGKKDFPSILKELHRLYPQTAIILTLGKEGLMYADENETVTLGTYLQAPVVDTTAAGDTFTGFFLAGIADGKDARDSLLFATAASSLCVGRKGAAPSIPLKEEVEDSLRKGTLGPLSL